jgi:hypothetical protein
MISTVQAIAQEGAQHEMDAATVKETPKTDPDPSFSTESEIKNNKLTTPVTAMPAGGSKEALRDTAQVKIMKPIKPAEKAQKEEDPLSFNFLYYIIEKFKLSDVIK